MSTKSKPLGHADLSTLYGQLATLDANPTIEAIRTARESYGKIADQFAAAGNDGEARRIRALGNDLLVASISKSGNVGTVDITALKKEVARQKKQLAKIEDRLTALETASKQHSATLYGTVGDNPTPGLQTQVNELVKNDGVLARLTNTVSALNDSVNGTAERRNEDGSTIPATPGINGRIGRIEGDMAAIFGNLAQPDQPSLQSRVTALENRINTVGHITWVPGAIAFVIALALFVIILSFNGGMVWAAGSAGAALIVGVVIFIFTNRNHNRPAR